METDLKGLKGRAEPTLHALLSSSPLIEGGEGKRNISSGLNYKNPTV